MWATVVRATSYEYLVDATYVLGCGEICTTLIKKKNLMSFTAVCAGNRGHGLGTRTAPMPPRSQGPGASSTPRRGRNAPRGEATSQCSDVPRFCKKTLRTKFGRIQIWVCSLLSYVSYVRTYGTLSLRVSYHTDKDTNEACEREARAKYS